MARPENDVDLIEIAIVREIKSYQFFMMLSDTVTNPDIAELCRELAQEELEHKSKLELECMKLAVTVDTGQRDVQVSDEELASYLYTDKPIEQLDYPQLLRLCIEKEDMAFRSFADLLVRLKSNHLKEVLLSLMQEELRHKVKFENEYERYLEKS